MNEFTSLIHEFGWPGGILVICGIFAWKAFKKLAPLVEKAVNSYVVRQNEMIEHSKNLTEKTIAIQQANQQAIEKLQGTIERLFRSKARHEQR